MHAPPPQDLIQENDAEYDLERRLNYYGNIPTSSASWTSSISDEYALQKVKNIPIGSKLLKSLVTKLLILPTKFLPFLVSPADFGGSGAFFVVSSDGAFPLPFAEAGATAVLELEVAE